VWVFRDRLAVKALEDFEGTLGFRGEAVHVDRLEDDGEGVVGTMEYNTTGRTNDNQLIIVSTIKIHYLHNN